MVRVIFFNSLLIRLSWQVCRGTAVMMVSPTQGAEEISNPFEEEEGGAAP